MDKSTAVYIGLVGTSMYLREHNFRIVYFGVVH